MANCMGARVTRTDYGAELRFPYNAWIVDSLKSLIPVGYRAWDPDAHCWTVEEPYVDQAIGILRQVHKAVRIDDQRIPRAGATSGEGNSYATLHLLPTAPKELVDAAYRCLARLYHPDTGGNTTKMQALNLAYEHLKQQVA